MNSTTKSVRPPTNASRFSHSGAAVRSLEAARPVSHGVLVRVAPLAAAVGHFLLRTTPNRPYRDRVLELSRTQGAFPEPIDRGDELCMWRRQLGGTGGRSPELSSALRAVIG
jgi:hypothetical protein